MHIIEIKKEIKIQSASQMIPHKTNQLIFWLKRGKAYSRSDRCLKKVNVTTK